MIASNNTVREMGSLTIEKKINDSGEKNELKLQNWRIWKFPEYSFLWKFQNFPSQRVNSQENQLELPEWTSWVNENGKKVSSFWKKEKQLFGILTNYGRKWMLLEWSIECREAVYMEIEGNLEFKRVNLKSVNKTTEWTVQTTYIKCTWNWNNNVKNLIEIIFSIYTCNQDIE